MRSFSKDPSIIIFIMVLGYMAISGGRFNDPLAWFLSTLYLLPGIIIAISFHEFAHAYSAYKLGDDTPRLQKRVTTNPVAHIDPIGLICIIFVGFGWGRPVMINPMNFRKRKRDELIVSLAGVATNLVLAIVFTIILAILARTMPAFLFATPIGVIIARIITDAIWINLILMVFNLLPIPPLDGFSVLSELLGIKYTEIWYKLHQFGMFVLMAFIFLGITRQIITVTVIPLNSFLISIAWTFAFG